MMMNGKQRIEALLSGQAPDRTPVLASTLAHATWLKKVNQRLFHTDARINAETIVEVSRELGLDGLYISSDNWIIHEALGGGVVFPEDGEPWWAEGPLIKEWADLDRLQVPDPLRAGRMPMMLESARRAAERVGGEMFIEANIDSGPYQLCMTLRGSENGALDPLLNPEPFHRLMEFCTEVTIAYGHAMGRTGVDAIQFGESSSSLVGPEIYQDFILPYDQRLIDALQQEKIKVVQHVCGNSAHLWDLLARTGADWIEVDSLVDLDHVFATVGAKMVIRGNVDTILLLNGPVEKIREAARQCLAKARRAGGRLILSPGCGVPKNTPPKHVQALIAVVQEEAEEAQNGKIRP